MIQLYFFTPLSSKESMRILGRLCKWLLILSLIGATLAGATLAGIYYYVSPQLPDVQTLRHVKFQTPLRRRQADRRVRREEACACQL
jgi:penicillin-binding protein 1A